MKRNTTVGLKIATIMFLTLSAGIILFPVSPIPKTTTVDFVRNINQLQTTNHGAPSQRDYLFEDESTSSSGQINTTPSSGTFGNTQQNNIQHQQTGLLNAMQESFYQAIASATNSEGLYTGSFGSLSQVANPGKIPTIATGTAGCTTPRGQKLENNDFVLAYEQRTDVPTICNVERRICTNGNLEGTYMQPSCEENVQYEYTKAQVISYNDPVVNPLIQPTTPSNAGANFSTEGKINQTKEPTNMWGSESNETTSTNGINQTQTTQADCTTPRGTTVNHGQFVKAYKTSIGLIDMPCETQLRLCVNGSLKGTYLNSQCTFKNMTYNDYLADNHDITKPTPQDVVDTLTDDSTSGINIFDRIRNLFR